MLTVTFIVIMLSVVVLNVVAFAGVEPVQEKEKKNAVS
jgi:hypothetical protein